MSLLGYLACGTGLAILLIELLVRPTTPTSTDAQTPGPLRERSDRSDWRLYP